MKITIWVISKSCSPWARNSIFCVFPLRYESHRLALQKNLLSPKKETHNNDRLLFDLQGKLRKSQNLFASIQGIIHQTHVLPIDAGCISREFLHGEIAWAWSWLNTREEQTSHKSTEDRNSTLSLQQAWLSPLSVHLNIFINPPPKPRGLLRFGRCDYFQWEEHTRTANVEIKCASGKTQPCLSGRHRAPSSWCHGLPGKEANNLYVPNLVGTSSLPASKCSHLSVFLPLDCFDTVVISHARLSGLAGYWCFWQVPLGRLHNPV